MFPANTSILQSLAIIKQALGESFTRSELVSFYMRHDVDLETKFIAAMIWGHEAPAGSRRDSRGPWKLSKMFDSPNAVNAILRISVNVTGHFGLS
jgi:hypothetical protein